MGARRHSRSQLYEQAGELDTTEKSKTIDPKRIGNHHSEAVTLTPRGLFRKCKMGLPSINHNSKSFDDSRYYTFLRSSEAWDEKFMTCCMFQLSAQCYSAPQPTFSVFVICIA
ncbi:uncharacterized protein EAE98_003955 [Botrytis deweyae]|uniref:Uncharacterized protein n=1 Tax=Botrytis deweyae TaxID=2478750 RepID=A0ABQ7IS65_9HELO|nr:uncharacterized protein EAE98_003955 [Botrytis deweyae]KAF7932656.1 hypothetical protein EAE98_003955 [Botrytis deweyae]